MAIEFRCSQCNQLLRVPEDSVGKKRPLPEVPVADDGARRASRGPGPPASQEPATAPFAGGEAPLSPLPPQPGPAPTPPKPADPFSFLNQPGGGAGGAMPPPPPGNPFAGLGCAATAKACRQSVRRRPPAAREHESLCRAGRRIRLSTDGVRDARWTGDPHGRAARSDHEPRLARLAGELGLLIGTT